MSDSIDRPVIDLSFMKFSKTTAIQPLIHYLYQAHESLFYPKTVGREGSFTLKQKNDFVSAQGDTSEDDLKEIMVPYNTFAMRLRDFGIQFDAYSFNDIVEKLKKVQRLDNGKPTAVEAGKLLKLLSRLKLK